MIILLVISCCSSSLGLVQPWHKLFMHYLQFASDNAEPRLIGNQIIGIVLYLEFIILAKKIGSEFSP
jgi:hypothetical protein